MAKLIIKTDITEWQDEVLRDENIITEEEDIYRLLDRGIHTNKIGRAAVVSRELGKAPADLIDPTDLLIQTGAAYNVSGYAKRRKVDVTLESGEVWQIPAYTGKGNTNENGNGETDNQEDSGPSYARTGSQLATIRAQRMLENQITGYIRNQLTAAYMGKLDVVELAEALKDRIDEIVRKITQPRGL